MADVQIAIIDQQNTQIALAAPPETQVTAAVPGVQGPKGEGVPTGGTVNQVLFKQSSTNYDTAWSAITSAMIGDLQIVDGDVSTTAAIAGTKISPNFGAQNVVTTGTSTAASFIPTSSSVPANGVYLPAANSLAISTNGSGRLFVDSSGRVGVGGTPNARFEITTGAGTEARITSTVDNNADLTFYTNSVQRGIVEGNSLGMLLGTTGALPTVFITNNTERMRLDSSGRLGIGTSAPIAKLDIYKGAGGSYADALILSNDAGFGANQGIAWGSSANISGRIRGLDDGAYGTHLIFESRAGSGPSTTTTERARIDSSGRLLVGTSSVTGIPATLNVIGGNNTVLHTQGANADSPFLFLSHARGTGTQSVNAQDGVGAVAFIGYDGTNALTAARIEAFVDGTPGANDMPGRLVFSTTADSASSPTPRMTIKSDGKVGIGTDSPGAKLEVIGGTTQAAHFIITGNNNPSGDGLVANFSAGGAGDPATTKGSYIEIGASSVGNVLLGCDGGYPGNIRLKTTFPTVRDLVYIDPIGDILLLPAGNEKFRVTSAGNVGIGTSSPTQALSVVGSIQLGATLAGGVSGTSYSILGNGATGGNASGGDVNVIAGAGSGSGVNGSVYISAGSTASPASVTTGGSVFITSGKPSDSLASGTIDFRYYAGNPSTLATAMRIDSSGRVGVGTTSPGFTVHANRSTAVDTFYGSQNSLALSLFGTDSAGGTVVYNGSAYPIQFSTNGTERARIDSSGRLLVGTSTARANFYNASTSPRFQVEGTNTDTSSIGLISSANGVFDGANLLFAKSRGTTIGSNTIVQNGDSLGFISFQGSDGTEFVDAANIGVYVDGTPGANDMPGRLVFSTTADGASSPTERMRIRSDGYVSFGQGATNPGSGVAGTLIYAGDGGILITNNTNPFLRCYTLNGGFPDAFQIANNGNATNANNSYGAISDIKLKENIVDANSQWDDLKALQVRNYNLKEGQTHTQIGLIAQEVELVSPGLVNESPDLDAEGNDLGTVTKSVNYSVLYMKAVKALQEAMERIETLEAKVAALEAA